MIKPFPHYQQLDSMDCGPSCLRMIAKYYGRSYSLQNLRERSFITRQGVSMLGISDAAESIGFRTRGVRISLEQLIEDVPLPCILHWNQDHFVVLYGIKKKRAGNIFKISDPAEGKYEMDTVGFEKCWISTKKDGKDSGTALALAPTPDSMNELMIRKNRKEICLSIFAIYFHTNHISSNLLSACCWEVFSHLFSHFLLRQWSIKVSETII